MGGLRSDLALKLPVLSNVLDLARYTSIAAAKQVVWKGAGAISNGPAEQWQISLQR